MREARRIGYNKNKTKKKNKNKNKDLLTIYKENLIE